MHRHQLSLAGNRDRFLLFSLAGNQEKGLAFSQGSHSEALRAHHMALGKLLPSSAGLSWDQVVLEASPSTRLWECPGGKASKAYVHVNPRSISVPHGGKLTQEETGKPP